MLMNFCVPLLLLSAAAGMQELDEATSSCAAATQAEPRRCLIQQQKASVAALQMAKSRDLEASEPDLLAEVQRVGSIFDRVLMSEESAVQQEKEAWTGEMVDVEFSKSDPDMQGAVEKTIIDYTASSDKAVALASNTTKTKLEVTFPNREGGQIVSNSSADKIEIYGFTKGTTGMVNAPANRIWTKKPGDHGAKLVYGFTMLEVPGDKDWKYNIEFAGTPPAGIKVYPENGKVAQLGNMLAIIMICEDDDLCGTAGDFSIAAVQFIPFASDQKKMKKPEDVVGKEAALVAEQDTKVQSVGSIFDQVLMSEESTAQQEKEAWTGSMVDLELSISAPDMQGAVEKTMIDYSASSDKAVALASNTTKTFIEVTFPNTEGGQIVSNSSSDKISIYGFSKGTTGMVNAPANRLWTKKPSDKGAMLVYGFTMFEVPGDQDWKFNIEFAGTPPEGLKIYPKSGKAAQIGNMLAILMICEDEQMCGTAGDFSIAAVQFIPYASDQKKMKKPEDVVGKETALVAEQDTKAGTSSREIQHMLEQIFTQQPPTEGQIQTRMLGEKKGGWTGSSVSVSFAASEVDMANVQTLTMTDYAAEDNATLALASNVTKTYMEMSFPNTEGSQIVSDSSMDKITIYGFEMGTSGLKNSNANRIWVKSPSDPDSKLLYAFRMSEAPGDQEWKYSVTFTTAQPAPLVIYPPGGKVAQIDNELFIVMVCDDPLECGDGKFTVSEVTFSPTSTEDEQAMKEPEDVVPKQTS